MLFGRLIDLLVPPRITDTLVRSLSIDDLHNLQTSEGLPYHDHVVRALIWEVKYFANAHARRLAGELLAEEITYTAAEEVGRPLLVPVPMHHARRKTRGHNQTELMCQSALEFLRDTVEYRCDVLKRIVDTPTQQGLERSKRLKNVHNSMVADSDRAAGRVCIVVDDVTTTGATLAEAKRALKAAGARSVHTIALAYS